MGLPEELVKLEYELSTKLSSPAVTATGGFKPSATLMGFLAQGKKARVIQRIHLFQQSSAGIHATSNLTIYKQHKVCFKHFTTFPDDRDI